MRAGYARSTVPEDFILMVDTTLELQLTKNTSSEIQQSYIITHSR